MNAREALQQKRNIERETLLISLDQILDTPMVILSFIMLGLFLVEMGLDLSPGWIRTISLIQWFIWFVFTIEFMVKFAISPNKKAFLRSNWLTGLAVVLPVLRILRIARIARAARSLRALRFVTVGNRSIRQLGYMLGRRHLQYVFGIVVIVTMLSGAGIYFLERSVPDSNIQSFGDGLWWSSGTITTVSTQLYPISAEGRVLAVAVMIFGVVVFGYVAGSLASIFNRVDTDADAEERAAKEPDSDQCSQQLLEEIKELKEMAEQLSKIASGQKPEQG